MIFFNRFFSYLNPIAHLGTKKYSFFFPFTTTLIYCGFLELLSRFVFEEIRIIGLLAIVGNLLLIIYFSLRSGILGGFASVLITLAFYIYLISTRQYSGSQLTNGLFTTAILGLIYFSLALLIGWLKQTVDRLIEREANEKRRLQTIIQQLPVGVVIADTKGNVIQTNEQVRSILGKSLKDGYVVGVDEPLLFNSKDGKIINKTDSPILQVLKSEKVTKNKEFMIAKPSGRKGYVLLSTAPIHNRSGECVAAVAILQDITIMREIEKRKDDFVNMASHELKTPITSLVLFMDILKRRLKSKEYAQATKALRGIEKQADSLQELINNLLDVSRIQTGKLIFKRDIFELNDLISEAVDSLQEGNRIIIVKNRKLKVRGDRMRIYQVITNLITNAMKYSPQNKQINVTLEKDGKFAKVIVQDYGIGIKKEQQKKIFEKLYQVSDDKAGTFPGFGMGLFISREIIRRHKGKIWVESEEGKGSKFYFLLPL